MAKHVFISHASADCAAAERVRDDLESDGIACWMAPRDVPAGDDYAKAITDAIGSCNLRDNRQRVVVAERKQEQILRRKQICLCHDIEAGLGHRVLDARFAEQADRSSGTALSRMLAIEGRLGIRATYNVVGSLLAEVGPAIRKDTHCVAFHSYDHNVARRRFGSAILRSLAQRVFRRQLQQPVEPALYQLSRCRTVDYRLKGYRVPQSTITTELTPENLCYHNFEWLASSARSLGISAPTIDSRIVYIPIHFDDWPMHASGLDFETWGRQALETIAAQDFVAFCLHDCYADYWLPSYERFLRTIQGLGIFLTLDEVASDMFLGAAG